MYAQIELAMILGWLWGWMQDVGLISISSETGDTSIATLLPYNGQLSGGKGHEQTSRK